MRLATLNGAAAYLLLCNGCSPKADSQAEPRPPANQPTEQRRIIGAIATDLVEMATFAANPGQWSSLPPGAIDVRETAGVEPGLGYALAIRLPSGGDPVKSDLKVTASAWSPELYTPALHELFARLKLSPPAAGESTAAALSDANLLKTLANPLTDKIEGENRQLSAWLQEHPLDARAQEQAALLLGTLALRENSGFLWNPRGLCNRATAHLALARALQPEVSTCGEVAELLIGLIIDTKADCQKRIAALQGRVAEHPELGPWTLAAALRNTRDYRLLANPAGATLLERVELFRALSDAISAEQAINRMEQRDPNTAPDWSRIILEVGYGVGSGHQFAMPSLGLEMGDAALVFPGLRTARTPEQFAAILNPSANQTPP